MMKNYKQALGDALGSRLYEAVADLLTMDQMVRYGKDLADSLLDAAVKAASEKSTGMNLTNAAQEQVVGGLEALLDPVVERMIRSETGEKLVQKLQHGVGSNPYAVAAIGILAAAGAFLTDADIPTLKQSIKLGGGFEVRGSVDLGSLRNIALVHPKLESHTSAKMHVLVLQSREPKTVNWAVRFQGVLEMINKNIFRVRLG